MRRWLISAAILLGSSSAAAYCPCYTASSSNNTHNCGIEAKNGTNPSVTEWQGIFDLVAQGPTVWQNQGPAVADIGQGCGNPEPLHDVPAKFACELLKAIAMAESGWTQFCVPDTPSDQVGGASRTIISFDCGYGVGQVTSGMHAGENPSFDQQRVAGEATYNLATGASILASKWRATKCVGDNQPTIVEDWYTAVWAYNGLAYTNNPSNPKYSSSRGVYNPQVGGAAPYQEKVFGRVEYPTGSYWESVPLAYPDVAEVGGSGAPPNLSEPHCASPTDCANTRPVHTSNCFGGTTVPDAGTGGAAGSVGTGGAPPDAGPSTGGGATIDAGPSTGGGSSGQKTKVVSDDASGCSCRVAGSRHAPSSLWFLSIFGLLALRRRKSC
ncbi:MAG: hypothetical protein KC776_25145 [Myxococcales bacterium]|nr:hypothetical protein [Myxococcales bacterium]MCB9578041.1 hypothetical protein [Polyangiaceae bacterium]